jgi:hypothetical protein
MDGEVPFRALSRDFQLVSRLKIDLIGTPDRGERNRLDRETFISWKRHLVERRWLNRDTIPAPVPTVPPSIGRTSTDDTQRSRVYRSHIP